MDEVVAVLGVPARAHELVGELAEDLSVILGPGQLHRREKLV